jgi:hypothetical protein
MPSGRPVDTWELACDSPDQDLHAQVLDEVKSLKVHVSLSAPEGRPESGNSDL